MNPDNDYRERWCDEKNVDSRNSKKEFFFKEAGVSRFNDTFDDEEDYVQHNGFESPIVLMLLG